MKIKLDVQSLDLDEDYEAAPAKEGTPLTILVRAIAQALEQHPDLQSVATLTNLNSHPDILFPDQESTVVVEVILCDKSQDIPMILNTDMEAPLGVFATSSGAFDQDSWYADKFRVIVAVNEAALREFFRDQRQLEMDPQSNSHDREYLKAYLNTLPHEIAHAVEFISHGGGLTPDQVDIDCEHGLLDCDMQDICTGRGIRHDMPASLEDDEADDIMEERVEAQGREWLDWALQRVPAPLVEACLKAYAPKPKHFTHEDTGPGL
jgi:hypothetical protein